MVGDRFAKNILVAEFAAYTMGHDARLKLQEKCGEGKRDRALKREWLCTIGEEEEEEEAVRSETGRGGRWLIR